jgi:hypothetical protein
MITGRYNTDAVVWRTQLLCVCRLMSGEQTNVVSNSYATYYWVRSPLKKTGIDLSITWSLPIGRVVKTHVNMSLNSSYGDRNSILYNSISQPNFATVNNILLIAATTLMFCSTHKVMQSVPGKECVA